MNEEKCEALKKQLEDKLEKMKNKYEEERYCECKILEGHCECKTIWAHCEDQGKEKRKQQERLEKESKPAAKPPKSSSFRKVNS